ncbi:hypothetical protein HHK36_012891 [Tetracentron sinense]|uniref:CRIB domain-containing protein n=1 Tax=Tetracentron sinense TaxID=13715 RepID=A0A834Z9R5_TETSI|nr:hypothetical protein HHK36_012891 [Tetracentron sinense]
MTTKMKGLLKGLRYISQIFDNGKEQEMQIGFPTDVKHVAHIGWDGPSVNSPSWMDGFRETPEFSSAPLNITRNPKENPATKSASADLSRMGAGVQESPTRELPRPSRRNSSTAAPTSLDSPTREPSNVSKQPRRRQSTGVSINSPTRDSPDNTKPTRRYQNSGLGVGSSPQDSPAIPRQSRRRKSKGSIGGGSTRPSRSKGHTSLNYTSPFSDPGSGSGSVPGLKNSELYPTSPLKAYDGENKGFAEIYREIHD